MLAKILKIDQSVVNYVLLPLLEPPNPTDTDIGKYGLGYRLNEVQNFHDCFYGACKGGNTNILYYILTRVELSFSFTFLEKCMLEACKSGNLDIVELLQSQKAIINENTLSEACLGGHKKLVKQFLHHFKFNNINFLLRSVVEKGDLEITKLLLQTPYYKDLDWSLYGACRGGNLDIVKLLISKGAKMFNFGLCGAIERGHKHIVNYLVENFEIEPTVGLQSACRSGNKDICQLMIKLGATRCSNCETEHR